MLANLNKVKTWNDVYPPCDKHFQNPGHNLMNMLNL